MFRLVGLKGLFFLLSSLPNNLLACMWDLMVVMETWWPLEATLCSSEKLRCFFSAPLLFVSLCVVVRQIWVLLLPMWAPMTIPVVIVLLHFNMKLFSRQSKYIQVKVGFFYIIQGNIVDLFTLRHFLNPFSFLTW